MPIQFSERFLVNSIIFSAKRKYRLDSVAFEWLPNVDLTCNHAKMGVSRNS